MSLIINLVRVKTFAKMLGKTTAYIYKLKKEGEIDFFTVDGVHFIDIEKNKSFINPKTRVVTRKINKIISKLK